MMAPSERLIHMANQIAANFAVRGTEDAVLATADHIDAFWAGRMKDQLSAASTSALSPIAARAVAHLRERSMRMAQTRTTVVGFVTQSGGSDAG